MTDAPNQTADIWKSDPALMAALLESWNHGYAAALESVRDLAGEFGDEQIKAALLSIAETLEEMRPRP